MASMAPLLALILVGCLDLGRGFHVHMAAANAAHVGLMYAQQVTNPITSDPITVANVIAKTVNAAQGSIDTSQMQVGVCLQSVSTCPIMDTSKAVDSDKLITVSVTVPFTTITPFVHLGNVGGSASGRALHMPSM